MIDFEVAKRIKCSIEEKKDVLKLIDTIIQISDNVRMRGLSSIDRNNMPPEIPFLLRKGLILAADGIDALSISDILNNYIVSGDYSGVELLKRIIIIDGIQRLQRGDISAVIREALNAYLGEDFIEKMELIGNPADSKDVMKAIASRSAINTYRRNTITENVIKDIYKLNDVEDYDLAERLETIEPESLEPLLSVCEDALKNRIISLMPEGKRNSINNFDRKNVTMEEVQLSLLILGILPGLE